MNKIETVRLTIETGDVGHTESVRIVFNRHEVELAVESGSTEAGTTFVGSFDVHSVAHTVVLLAPAASSWVIRDLRASFVGPEPLENCYSDVELEPGGELDILTPPVVSFDV